MTRFYKTAVLAGLLGSLGITFTIYAQQNRVANPASTIAANVTNDVLRRAGAASDPLAGAWLSYGRAQSETRYSTLKQIDATNAKRLGLAWSYVMGAGGGNQEGTPLMWNNTLYGITTWSVVFALDARTGKELWRWDPEVNPATRPVICCGIVNRGIALYNGMIIAPSIDGRLFALNAQTGKPVWETRVVYTQDLYTLTMAPRIANGKVIIGASGSDKPTRGQFGAILQRRMRARRCVVPRIHGVAISTRMAAAEPCGTALHMIPIPIWFTSAPATPSPGCRSSGAHRVSTISIPAPSWLSI
jgi:glucose dehydrogenase